MSRYGYGNFGHYRGETLDEMITAKRGTLRAQYDEIAWQIVDLIGQDEYERWVDACPDDYTLQQWIDAAKEKLDDLRYEECECRPGDVMACPACRHRNYQREHGTIPQDALVSELVTVDF